MLDKHDELLIRYCISKFNSFIERAREFKKAHQCKIIEKNLDLFLENYDLNLLMEVILSMKNLETQMNSLLFSQFIIDLQEIYDRNKN